MGEEMRVRDLGAAGDGAADATAALQEALDAGGCVRIPRGRYRITRPLEIDLATRGPAAVLGEGGATLLMAGPGPALRLAGTHAGSAHPETVLAAVWERERMPLVDGLEILGDHPEADGIEI